MTAVPPPVVVTFVVLLRLSAVPAGLISFANRPRRNIHINTHITDGGRLSPFCAMGLALIEPGTKVVLASMVSVNTGRSMRDQVRRW